MMNNIERYRTVKLQQFELVKADLFVLPPQNFSKISMKAE